MTRRGSLGPCPRSIEHDDRASERLWLIGVAKDGSVPGAQSEELANWWPAVEKRFDPRAPSMQTVNVAWNGVTVVALAFETDEAPYVVKNISGGAPEREVPWREGNRTRSAMRDELLRILVPRSSPIAAQFQSVVVNHVRVAPAAANWSIEYRMLIDYAGAAPTYLLVDGAHIVVGDEPEQARFAPIAFESVDARLGVVVADASCVRIAGPGIVKLTASPPHPQPGNSLLKERLRGLAHLALTQGSPPIAIEFEMQAAQGMDPSYRQYTWRLSR